MSSSQVRSYFQSSAAHVDDSLEMKAAQQAKPAATPVVWTMPSMAVDAQQPQQTQPCVSSIYDLPRHSPVMTPVAAASNTTPSHQTSAASGNVITVFGFPPESSNVILSMFRHFGPILAYQWIGNSNWMLIEFKEELAAQMALSKNGMIVGGDLMIGVVPFKSMHASCETRPESLSQTLSPYHPIPPSAQRTGSRSSPLRRPLSSLSATMTPNHATTTTTITSTHRHPAYMDTPTAAAPTVKTSIHDLVFTPQASRENHPARDPSSTPHHQNNHSTATSTMHFGQRTPGNAVRSMTAPPLAPPSTGQQQTLISRLAESLGWGS